MKVIGVYTDVLEPYNPKCGALRLGIDSLARLWLYGGDMFLLQGIRAVYLEVRPSVPFRVPCLLVALDNKWYHFWYGFSYC